MTTMDYGQLAYLVLLGSALLLWFFTHNRQSLGKTARQAFAWVFIFIGVIAVIGLWDDIRNTVRPSQGMVMQGGKIEVPRANDGHYYLTLAVNGKAIEFLIDTGASEVVLSHDDAARAGVPMEDLAFHGRAMTANGEVRTAPVHLDLVKLGPVEDRNVRAWVNEGEMDQSLLGMAYLQRWSRIEIVNGKLVLTR